MPTSPLRFLWCATSGYRRWYLWMMLAPLVAALYAPLAYYALKLTVDALDAGAGAGALLGSAALYLTVDLGAGLAWRIHAWASWRSEPFVRSGIVVDAVARVLSYPMAFFHDSPAGGMASKIRGLTVGYDTLWAQLNCGIALSLLALVANVGGIVLVRPWLGAIALVWVALAAAVNVALARRVQRVAAAAGEARHRTVGAYADILGNAATVKGYAARRRECRRLRLLIGRDAIPAEVAELRLDLRVGLVNDALRLLFIVAMLGGMLRLWSNHAIGAGDMVFVFGAMLAVSERLFESVQQYQMLAERLGDLRSALALLDAGVDEYGGAHTAFAAPPGIEFRDVDFAYAGGHRVFQGLNLTIAPGEKVGIVGATGAGKSSLVQLLLKMQRPGAGCVCIGGQDIATLDADALRRCIGLIPQDISLFHRDLRANIAYGKPGAGDAAIEHAARRAHAHGFIMRLAAGYATPVGERGVKLSGGQRQRIGIARALLKDAPILVLDEATSSLDSRTEALIHAALRELIDGKTVLAIAHRLSTLQDMDRIVVLDHGRVVESGTHAELLADPDSRYAALWAAQGGKARAEPQPDSALRRDALKPSPGRPKMA